MSKKVIGQIVPEECQAIVEALKENIQVRMFNEHFDLYFNTF